MAETIVVSVTDGRMVNINAALVLYLNMIDVCTCKADRYLLACRDQVAQRYIDCFYDIGVNVLVFDMPESEMRDDPYRVKYLLKYFVDGVCSDENDVVYLDPDHTIQKDIAFAGVERCDENIIVSSEVKSYKNGMTQENHFNTSLMIAKAGVFRCVFGGWLNEYECIRNDVGVRYREEIAMVIAANKQQIPVKPCHPEFQCTLDDYCQQSQLCHYGGESVSVGKIKKILDCDDYHRIMQEFGRFRFAESENGEEAVVRRIGTYINTIKKELA